MMRLTQAHMSMPGSSNMPTCVHCLFSSLYAGIADWLPDHFGAITLIVYTPRNLLVPEALQPPGAGDERGRNQ